MYAESRKRKKKISVTWGLFEGQTVGKGRA
jgi:hypothetical protein